MAIKARWVQRPRALWAISLPAAVGLDDDDGLDFDVPWFDFNVPAAAFFDTRFNNAARQAQQGGDEQREQQKPAKAGESKTFFIHPRVYGQRCNRTMGRNPTGPRQRGKWAGSTERGVKYQGDL